MDSTDVVRLVSSRKRDAAEVLVEAFRDDADYRYVFPDEEERVRSMRRLWNALLLHTLLFGEVYTTSGLHGVACWLPMRGPSVSLWQLLRTGFALPRAVLSFSGEGRRRLADALQYNDDVHRRLVRENHWYLGALGVAPPHQHRGIGGRLLQPILARADAQGKPCYLETQTRDNVRFYERHGFQVVHHGEVPGHPLQMWAMLRPSATTPTDGS